jgi:Pyruvate/2-oxoacid:ferredoxin oxidoreductase delta subunit
VLYICSALAIVGLIIRGWDFYTTPYILRPEHSFWGDGMSESVLIWITIGTVSAIVFAHYFRQFTRRAKADEIRQESARRAGIDKAPSQDPHIDEIACIGCRSCVDACPEGDVLGVVSGRAVFINGLRCVGHGRCAEVPRAASSDAFDLIIVGAGPAGLAAALTAKRDGLRALVLDQQGVGGVRVNSIGAARR